MTATAQLHNREAHRDGFDPDCPQCLADQGILGIIHHLESCARRNEADARAGATEDTRAVAKEQRRMAGVLELYRKSLADERDNRVDVQIEKLVSAIHELIAARKA